MQISQNEESVTVEREIYIKIVNGDCSMQNSKPARTPTENSLKLVTANEDEQLVDEKLYSILVGSLLHISGPVVGLIVNVPCRFIKKPTNFHWLDGKRVVRCLQHTKSLMLVYPLDNDFNLTGESDAERGGDHDDRRSTTGYFFRMGLAGGAVSWQTKKQQTVALSSCEVDYQRPIAAVKVARFLRSLLCNIGSHLWETQSKLHETGKQPCEEQEVQTHRHKVSLHTKESG